MQLATLYLVGFYLEIFIPTYLVPGGAKLRFAILTAMMIWLAANYLLGRRLLGSTAAQPRAPKPSLNRSDLRNLAWILIPATTLRFFLATKAPIFSRSDEATHIQGGLGMFVKLNQLVHKATHLPLPIMLWIAIIIVAGIAWTLRRPLLDRWRRYSPTMWFRALVITGLALFGWAMSIPLIHGGYEGALHRFPPMFKGGILIALSLFGIHEWAPRLIPILFSALATIYVYRLARKHFSMQIAVWSSLFFTLNPLVLSFSYLCEIGIGVFMFMILTVYYFLDFLNDMNERNLGAMCLVMGLGAYYKQDLWLLPLLVGFYLILFHRKWVVEHLGRLTLFSWFTFAPAIPAMIFQFLFSIRQYKGGLPPHELLWKAGFNFNYLTMNQSLPILVLVGFAFLYALRRLSNPMYRFMFYFTFVFFAFYLIDNYPVPVHRFQLFLILPFLWCLSDLGAGLIRFKKDTAMTLGAATLLFLLLLLRFPCAGLAPQFSPLNDLRDGQAPLQTALESIQTEIDKDHRCYVKDFGNYSFYRDKLGLNRDFCFDSANTAVDNLSSMKFLVVPGNLDVVGTGLWNGTNRIPIDIESQRDFTFANGMSVRVFSLR
jgi:4-amino-4-deoxy-L-arabinose transferase-like glycosyltransferase